jgi:hypothetical protein
VNSLRTRLSKFAKGMELSNIDSNLRHLICGSLSFLFIACQSQTPSEDVAVVVTNNYLKPTEEQYLILRLQAGKLIRVEEQILGWQVIEGDSLLITWSFDSASHRIHLDKSKILSADTEVRRGKLAVALARVDEYKSNMENR